MNNNNNIFFITNENDWNNSKELGIFVTPSLKDEGFVHASTRIQLMPVLNAYFLNSKKLIILEASQEKLSAPLKFEYVKDWDQSFPHLFGPLKVEEVIKTYEITSSAEGNFKEENLAHIP